MSEIADFLTERLDEDERELVKDPPNGLGYACLPARMAREIEAKRAIMERHKPDRSPADQWYGHDVRCEECGGVTGDVSRGGLRGFNRSWPCRTYRLLALPYSDHPGYREEWKP